LRVASSSGNGNGHRRRWRQSRAPQLRRAKIGIQHHIANAHSAPYDSGVVMAGRQPRGSNGDQATRLTHLAMKRGKSVDFTEY
jgi:hypothetical protein